MTHITTDNLLRDVNIDGCRLRLYDAGRYDSMGKNMLGYEFFAPATGFAVPLFAGEDFSCSPMYAIDSDNTLRSLLGFLTLRPGDTDREYFAEYTPAQLAFAHSKAEYLSLWACEADREFPALPFIDWTGVDPW